MIPRYPKRRDIRHRLVKTIERQRKDDISRVAESSDSSGGAGIWAETGSSGWEIGTAGSYAQAKLGSVWDQSVGGVFTIVDDVTLSIPEGLYMVEWDFNFRFPFVEPYTGHIGDGWALWRGGPVSVANSVLDQGSYDEKRMIPLEFQSISGSDHRVSTHGNKLTAWRGIVRAVAPDNLNLSLGIVDLTEFFPDALDWAQRFGSVLQGADTGTGDQYIRIASIGS